MLREGGSPVIRHHIARAVQGDDDLIALHFDAQVDLGSCHTVRAAAAVEASVAAKVPAVAAVLPALQPEIGRGPIGAAGGASGFQMLVCWYWLVSISVKPTNNDAASSALQNTTEWNSRS